MVYPKLGQGPKEDIFSPRLSDILVTTEGLIGSELGAVGNAIVAPNHKAVVAPNGEVIQIASKGYALLDDNYLQEQVDAIIADSDGGLVLHSRTHPRPWATSWSIVEKEPIGSIVYGDTEYQVGFVIRLDNSYDSSRALSVRAGIQILKCSNQLVSSGPKRQSDFYAKHSVQSLINMDGILQTAAQDRKHKIALLEHINKFAGQGPETVVDGLAFGEVAHTIVSAFPEAKGGASQHAYTLDTIFKRDAHLYGDGYFGLLMAATELATYPKVYSLPLSYVSPLNNAINEAFRLN